MTKHPMHRVRAFEIVAPYTLRIEFENATNQVIDFEPVLRGELYGPLRDPAMFNRVSPDGEAQTLVWPNLMAPTSIRRRFTTGRNANQSSSRWRPVGKRPVPDGRRRSGTGWLRDRRRDASRGARQRRISDITIRRYYFFLIRIPSAQTSRSFPIDMTVSGDSYLRKI